MHKCRNIDTEIIGCNFTYLPLVLLLVLLTESELDDRLREPDPLWERGGRVAWLTSL